MSETEPRADGAEETQVDPALVDAVLAASSALASMSARSVESVAEVTLPQYRMLLVLERAPSNLTHLADTLTVAPSTALRMIDRLIAAKLVERTVRQENRRETHLAITAEGRQVVEAVTARRRHDVGAVLRRMPQERRASAAQLMADFSAAADLLWPPQVQP